MTASLLEAHVVVDRQDWSLDIEIAVARGSVTALLGPNGAGKSTVVQALAGLQRLDAGQVMLSGRHLEDAAAGVRIPAESRRIGVVFQDYLLFPRMSARDNVAFGMRARGVDKSAARSRADRWLARLDLAAHPDRRPGQLSGGQAQRVALARALATDPELLLLDEPLAALDAGSRMTVRTDLQRHLADFPGATILVTHEPLDALILADQVVVIESGRVVQTGAPAVMARHPRTSYVAQLVGLNLMRGVSVGRTVALDDGTALTVGEPNDGPVFVVARPSAVGVYAERPYGSPRNTWHSVVVGLEQHGHAVRLSTDGPPQMIVDVTADAVGELRLSIGTPIWLSVKATDLVVYPA